MPKKSVSNRNAKRILLSAKYRPERARLKKIISDPKASREDKWQAQLDLQKLPRDSSPVRIRRRCRICERPRAVDKKTGLCRLDYRKLAETGMIPGMCKSSW